MKNRKTACFFILLMLTALLSSAACGEDPVPEAVAAECADEFYGVWRCEYIVQEDDWIPFEDYFDELFDTGDVTEIDGRMYYLEELGQDYRICIGKNAASDLVLIETWGTWVNPAPAPCRLENGAMLLTREDGAVSCYELLSDGSLRLRSIPDDGRLEIYEIASLSADSSEEAYDSLSDLSYEELIDLKNRINLALWESDEWEEITVPQGLWEVGKDIPAGTWDIACATNEYADVYYGDEIAEDGVSLRETERYCHREVVSPGYTDYEEGKSLYRLTVTVENGDYIVIGQSDVIFTPTEGNPDFEFN